MDYLVDFPFHNHLLKGIWFQLVKDKKLGDYTTSKFRSFNSKNLTYVESHYCLANVLNATIIR